jgi:nitrite reductase/ring-hydroxylating ferredoxin subunit
MSETAVLCAIEEIPEGGARGFPTSPAGPVFAVRRGRTVFLYRDRCPHQGAQLPWRRDAYLSPDGSQIVCFAHGARFEVETGLCTAGPCLGERLARVPFELTGTGSLMVSAEDDPLADADPGR